MKCLIRSFFANYLIRSLDVLVDDPMVLVLLRNAYKQRKCMLGMVCLGFGGL
jgi:hypothetical protein